MTLPHVARGVLETIGHTPVVRLQHLAPSGGADVFVKLEDFNPTGSYKDRMALAMIEGAEARGVLRPGMRVIEFTGGSTGSSLAMVCAVKGYRFEPLSSDAFAHEKIGTMKHSGEGGDGGERGRQGHTRTVRPLQGADRRDEGGAKHVLDRPVPQRRCVDRISGDRHGSFSSSSGPSTRFAAPSVPAACWSVCRAR